MEVVKAFNNNNVGMPIIIQGTPNEPLFRLNDIGSVLGMKTLNTNIRDFDESQKVLCKTQTLGGEQEMIFLTEFGLYEVLFRSRKPIAKKFKKWLCEVIKDIRLTGRYKLEQEKEKLENKLQEVNEEIEIKISENEERIIENFDKIIYAGYADKERTMMKFGYTNNLEDRLKKHKKQIGSFFTFEIIVPSVYNIEIEKMLKTDEKWKTYIIKTDTGENSDIRGKMINGKLQTEIIKLEPEKFNKRDLKNVLKSFKEIAERNLEQELEKVKMENKLLVIENEKMKLDNKELKKTVENNEKYIKRLKTKREKVEMELPIVSVDITTGDKTEFNTVLKAQMYHDIDFTTIRNYIDTHRQYKGFVFRSGKSKPYWELPKNFKFSNTVKPTTQTKYIKRVDKVTNEISYYNSITEAAMFLQQEDDGKEITELTEEHTKLRKAIGQVMYGVPTRQSQVNSYYWYRMKDIGFIVDPINKTRKNIEVYDESQSKQPDSPVEKIRRDYSFPNTDEGLENQRIFQNRIPIVVRNIKTGEEIIHPEGYSYKVFAKNYNLLKKQFFERYLNKCVNYKNLTFRTFDKPYWKPPKNYMSSESIGLRYINYFVKVKELDTGETYYYSNPKDIQIHLFPDEGKTVREALKRQIKRTKEVKIQSDNPTFRFSMMFKKYKWTRLKSCGTLVDKDGIETDIEQEYLFK